MKQLFTLMRWDFIHLYRNQLITISLFLGLIYFGIFYLIRNMDNADNFLVLLIYNDPVITGYIFAAVLLLFERNQNTLLALSVSPIRLSAYLWSKGIVLALLAWIVALCMTIAIRGWNFHFLHFSLGVLMATLLFVFCGFALTATCTSLNGLIARSVPLFIIFALPFLGLFEIINSNLWLLVPSYPGTILIKASFSEIKGAMIVYSYAYGLPAVAVSYFWALYRIKKNMSLV